MQLLQVLGVGFRVISLLFWNLDVWEDTIFVTTEDLGWDVTTLVRTSE